MRETRRPECVRNCRHRRPVSVGEYEQSSHVPLVARFSIPRLAAVRVLRTALHDSGGKMGTAGTETVVALPPAAFVDVEDVFFLLEGTMARRCKQRAMIVGRCHD